MVRGLTLFKIHQGMEHFECSVFLNILKSYAGSSSEISWLLHLSSSCGLLQTAQTWVNAGVVLL